MSTPTTPFYPMTHDDAQEIKTVLQGIQGKAVKYEIQSLTEVEQAQARANISAVGEDSQAATQEGMAIIADGDTHANIGNGQYVYVKNHYDDFTSTRKLAEGLYKAKAAIPLNYELSTSNLSAVSAGGMNDLKSEITTLNSNLGNYARHVWLESTDTTLAQIWSKLNAVPSGHAATFVAASQSFTVLSQNNLPNSVQGIVARVSSSQFEFILKYPRNNLAFVRIQNISASSFGDFYQSNIEYLERFGIKIVTGSNSDTGELYYTTLDEIPPIGMGRIRLKGTRNDGEGPVPDDGIYAYWAIGNEANFRKIFITPTDGDTIYVKRKHGSTAAWTAWKKITPENL